MQNQVVSTDILLYTLKNIANEIYKPHDLSMSLMEGTSGLVLFLDQYYSITKDKKLIKQRNSSIERLLDFVNHKSDLSLTYCDGLVGLLSFIRLLNIENKTNYYDFQEDMDDYLYQIMCENLSAGRLDILHGGLGIFWHYTIRLKTATDIAEMSRLQTYLDKGLEIMEKIAVKDTSGYRWKSSMKGNEVLKDSEIYNMGLAHGQPGILAILSLAYPHLKNKQTAHRIITESSKFIVDICNSTTLSQFPTHFCPDIPMPYNSRLAWCYGDLGISLALSFAAKSLADQDLKIRSEKIAMKSTIRKEIVDTSVFDAGLCHGSAGVSHMYGIWHQATGSPIFKQAQNYWLFRTIEYSNNSDGFAGFRTHIKDDLWGKDLGLLKGVSGVGLAITAYLTKGRSWDTLLMLS